MVVFSSLFFGRNDSFLVVFSSLFRRFFYKWIIVFSSSLSCGSSFFRRILIPNVCHRGHNIFRYRFEKSFFLKKIASFFPVCNYAKIILTKYTI